MLPDEMTSSSFALAITHKKLPLATGKLLNNLIIDYVNKDIFDSSHPSKIIDIFE